MLSIFSHAYLARLCYGYLSGSYAFIVQTHNGKSHTLKTIQMGTGHSTCLVHAFLLIDSEDSKAPRSITSLLEI